MHLWVMSNRTVCTDQVPCSTILRCGLIDYWWRTISDIANTSIATVWDLRWYMVANLAMRRHLWVCNQRGSRRKSRTRRESRRWGRRMSSGREVGSNKFFVRIWEAIAVIASIGCCCRDGIGMFWWCDHLNFRLLRWRCVHFKGEERQIDEYASVCVCLCVCVCVCLCLCVCPLCINVSMWVCAFTKIFQ